MDISRREAESLNPATMRRGPRPCLKDLNDRDWGNEIESVIMGPDASLLVYTETNFKGGGMAFVSNQRVLDLDKFQIANDVESLRVECKMGKKDGVCSRWRSSVVTAEGSSPMRIRVDYASHFNQEETPC